jgi:hypothetical protein
MARRRGKVAVGNPESDLVGDPAGDPGGMSLFDDMGADSYVIVHRIDDISKRPVFQFRLAPSEANEETLQRLRGGGYYVCKEKRRAEDGSWQWGRQRSVQIDGAPKPLRELPDSMQAIMPGPGAKTEDAAVGMAGSADVSLNDIMKAGVLNLLNAQQGVQTAMMKAVEAIPRPTAEKSPFSEKAMELLLQVLTREPPKQPDPMDLAKQVAAIIGERTSPMSGFKEMFDTMNRMLALRKRLNEDEETGTGDPLMDIIKENLPKIVGVIQQEQARKGQPVASTGDITRRLVPPVAALPAIAPASEPDPAMHPEVDMLSKWLIARRPVLRRAAETGVDPEAMAKVEWGMLPPEYRGVIREFLGREDAEQLTRSAIPEYAAYETWYGSFLEVLTLLARPEDYEEAEPESEDGGEA